MSVETPAVLLLGDTEHAEFRPILETVRKRIPLHSLRTVLSIAAAVQLADRDLWFPDLGVVCQTAPEQFHSARMARLLSTFPLTRWICAYSCWCDSAGRTQTVWPLSVRVPVSLAATRIARELAYLQGAAERDFPLPLTAARDEIFEYDVSQESQFATESFQQTPRPKNTVPNRAGCVTVRSPDRALRKCVAAQLRQAGYMVAVKFPDTEPATLVWDLDPWSNSIARQLQEHCQAFPHIPVLALAGFPRNHETEQMRQAGARVVIPKLAPAAEICRALSSLLPDVPVR